MSYVDEKKIRENIVLGFIIKPGYSSALNLLGKNQGITSPRIPEKRTDNHGSC